MNTIKTSFLYIDIDGTAVALHQTQKIRAFGVLPNEEAIVKIVSNHKDYSYAIPIEIVNKSPYRIPEKEDHFLSCSPWQIIDYNYQIELKREILKKIWKIEDIEVVKAKKTTGYRTKMEFSFFIDDSLNLAFFKRGTFKAKYKLPNGCILASDKLNSFALKILQNLNNKNADFNFKVLKGLTVRESKNFNQYLGVLFVKTQDFKVNVDIDFNEGLSVYYSDPKSPAFVFTQEIQKIGIDKLKEKIGNLDIFYSYKSFFQNNVELFEVVLRDMKDNIFECNKMVDLYCGVGVIGLFLSNLAKEVIGVEINEEASFFAQLNANLNSIKNFKILNMEAEKIGNEVLEYTDILIVDPPRSGLHPKTIKLILEVLPKVIVYLSCNPLTQFRDYSILKEKYSLSFIRAYDFYPLTPHLESLIILYKRVE